MVTAEDPSLGDLRADYETATKPWAGEFQILSREQFEDRFFICGQCPWRSDGRAGLGFCEFPELSCRKIKLWLALFRCPLGKFGPGVATKEP